MERSRNASANNDLIHPGELVKQALLTSGVAIILVHNHPSGLFDPSPEDRALTETIIGCAELFDIRVLDHIILEEKGFFSARQAGWI